MEFLIRNFDSTNLDLERDRMGCRKRGMCDAEMPDGHEWGRLEGLPSFVVIKCPEIIDKSELPGGVAGFRKVWRDNFDYEVIATRPAQGEYDVRVFETAQGGSGQNVLSGTKLARVVAYLQDWGCSNFAAEINGGAFTFSLWQAVQSINFWNIGPAALDQIDFVLDSYVDGVGTITVTVPTLVDPVEIEKQIQQVTRKITERGGTVTQTAYPTITFTIARSDILAKFRADVKHRMERTFMYQQHRLNDSVMDAAVAAGGTLTMTKAELIAAIRDMAAE